MKKQAYAALILAAIFSNSSAQHFDFTTYNVKMFMNTSWRIWTYNTTQKTKFFCKVDDMVNITEESVYFNRSYWNLNWTTVSLEGTFDKYYLSMMAVGGVGTLKDHSEMLLFASSNYQCGVFWIKPLGGDFGWYDLRFKDYNKTGKPEKECQDYFDSLQRPGYVLYGEYCQTLQ